MLLHAHASRKLGTPYTTPFETRSSRALAALRNMVWASPSLYLVLSVWRQGGASGARGGEGWVDSPDHGYGIRSVQHRSCYPPRHMGPPFFRFRHLSL